MSLYTGKLTGEKVVERMTRYRRRELENLTTLQLRDICRKERLVYGVSHKLNRVALVELIMKFRGINENAFIRDYDDGNWERLQRNIKRFVNTEVNHDGRIQVPAKMILFQTLAVAQHDDYRVDTGKLLGDSNVLVVDDEMNLYAVFNLREYDGKYYLTAADGMVAKKQSKVKHYNLLFFGDHESTQLYELYYGLNKLLPAQMKYYKAVAADMRIEELEATQMVLAVDFGSSATSAGAYLERGYVSYLSPVEMASFSLQADDINLVKFDGGKDNGSWQPLLPSVISVKDCFGTDNIVYRFGADALEYLNVQGYNTIASHFHEMKRWVNDINKVEELVDESDHVCHRTRKEILGAYIQHVIHAAEQQFKCRFRSIHLSAPVRLQPQFIQMYKDMLPGYEIVVDQALDEGLSVLYNSIRDLIDRGAYEEEKEYKALIFDCGGGTSDLVSCTFAIENGRIAYDVDINTTFENGNINFGGNNLTYRIMQYLKVLFARYYDRGETNTSLREMLSSDTFHAYRYLDSHPIEDYYKVLAEEYQKAEELIPTRFGDYRHAPRTEYAVVHGNFYFLWFAAEKLKRRFFETGDIYRSSFHRLGMKEDEYDLKVTPFEPWSLTLKKGEGFQHVYDYPKIIFNVEEIRHLILADVYCCMREFLQPFYDDDALGDFSMVRMVGQSCKIDSFKDSIKEFVPGKQIQFSQKQIDGQNLKLSCLRGAIAYLNDRRMGLVDASIQNALPVTPYEVTAFTHDGRELTMISSLERLTKSAGFVSRNFNTREIELHLKDAAGNVLYTYQIDTDFKDYTETDYTAVNTELSDRIRQDDVDNIERREIKFFVFAYENWWGFYVLPIGRNEEGKLFKGKRRFFSFENERWERDFFDGFH